MSAVATMSSREIADLLKIRHDSVKRAIERLSTTQYEDDLKTVKKQAVIVQPPLVDGEKSANNTVEKVYLVGKRESYIVVAQLSPEFTAALVDRWQELEAKQAPQIPQTYAAALLEAGRLALIVEEQSAKIATDAPKVKFAEAVRALDGSCDIESFAKALGTGRNRLFKWLRDSKYLMITNLPYQQYVDRGLFVVIEQTPYTDSEGKSHPTFKTMITGKGQVWLENKFNAVAEK